MEITLLVALISVYIFCMALSINVFYNTLGIPCDEDRAMAALVLGLFWPVGMLAIIGWMVGDKLMSMIKE